MIKPVSPQSGALLLAARLALSGAFVSLSPLVFAAEQGATQNQPQPPDALLGPLFTDVQSAKLFPDQKTFADAVPKNDPLMILADYCMQRRQSGLDLPLSVALNFILPEEGKAYVPPDGQTLRERIYDPWPAVTRTTESAGKWDQERTSVA